MPRRKRTSVDSPPHPSTPAAGRGAIGFRARPSRLGAQVLRSVFVAILAAGMAGLAAAAVGRGTFGRPPARAAQPQRIEVVLGADVIDPAVMLLLPGTVHFMVRNASGAPRAFSIEGHGVHADTGMIGTGGTETLDVTFDRPGTYIISDGRAHPAEGTLRVRRP